MKSCRGIAVLDEGVENYSMPEPESWALIFPDFADSTLQHCTAMGNLIRANAKGKTVVSLLGALQKRKGVLELLCVIGLLPRSDYYFCLIGHLYPRSFREDEWNIIKSFLDHPAENVFIHTKEIDDAEFDDIISSSNIIFAVYQDFPHSSNILAKAARFKVPVIVANGYCMAERVKTFGLGQAVKQDDTVEIVGAIEQLKKSGAQEPSWEDYSRLHSLKGVVDQLQAALITPY